MIWYRCFPFSCRPTIDLTKDRKQTAGATAREARPIRTALACRSIKNHGTAEALVCVSFAAMFKRRSRSPLAGLDGRRWQS